jgi:cell division protein YceG involved in septum cleavage
MKTGIIVSIVIGILFVACIVYPMYTCKAPNKVNIPDTNTDISMETVNQDPQSELKQHQSIVSNQINNYLQQYTEPNYLQDNYIIGTAPLQPATQEI